MQVITQKDSFECPGMCRLWKWRDTPVVELKPGRDEIWRRLYFAIKITKAVGCPCPSHQSVKRVYAYQYVHAWGRNRGPRFFWAGKWFGWPKKDPPGW